MDINPHGTVTKKESTSHTKLSTPAIVGGAIGGTAAICSVIGIIVFVQRRRRQRRAVFSDSMKDASQVMTTSFNPIPSDAALGSGTWAGQQPLGSEGPEAKMVALLGLSSTPPTVLPRD
jgi:cell division protein FtsW (lipid II flippase)